MRNYEMSMLGTVQIIGVQAEGLPMWSINHYIEEFCNNYNKILIIRRICELMQDGAYDSQFLVAKRSANLFPNKTVEESFTYNENNYVVLTTKNNNSDEFWRIIINYVRPIVFYRENDHILPLIDFTNEDAIKITSFNYNSPPIIDAQGIIGGIIDIANAKNRRDMEEENHIAHQIGQGVHNIEKIVHTSQIINDPRTPEGVKYYANNALFDLMNKQEKLNNRLGIRINRIDVIR